MAGMAGNGWEWIGMSEWLFPLEHKTLILLKKKVIINGVATRRTAGAARREWRSGATPTND